MGNFTNICQDIRNLTCRPRDNLTFKKELERQCHVQMLILLVAAFIVGCLLMISVRAINKYWCPLRRRRVFRPIYKARHAHKRLYTVLPKYSKIQVLPGITSCRLVKYNKQAIELNSLLLNNMPKDGYG